MATPPPAKNLNRWMKRTVVAKPVNASLQVPVGTEELAHAAICKQAGLAQLDWGEPEFVQQDGQILAQNIRWRGLLEILMHQRGLRDVCLELHSSRVGHPGELEKKLAQIHWPAFITSGSRISTSIRSIRSRVYHEGLIRSALLNSLAGHPVELVSEVRGQQHIRIDLIDNKLSVQISLCGEKLSRRGWNRNLVAQAPMPEDLAGALAKYLIDRGNRDDWSTIFNPFAGSGTLAFELYGAVAKRPVYGPARTFAMDAWPALEDKTRSHLATKANETVPSKSLPKVKLAEIDSKTHAALKKDVDKGLFGEQALCEKVDVLSTPWQVTNPALIAANPPHGHRLKLTPPNLYEEIGAHLNQLHGHWSCLIVAPGEAIAAVEKKLPGDLPRSNFDIRLGGLQVQVAYFSARPTD